MRLSPARDRNARPGARACGVLSHTAQGGDALSVAKVARGEAEPRSGRKRPRGWSARRRDERPMRGPHCGALRVVSRIPSGEDPPAPKASGRPTSEARSFRAAKVARGRARSAESTRSTGRATRPKPIAKVNASPSLGRVGGWGILYPLQSIPQPSPLTN